jgi:DNA-binding beta-propeller fold protein YncE
VRRLAKAVLIGALLAGCGTTPEEEAALAAQPKLAQSLGGFHHPDGCAFSPDGRRLYVTNSAAAEVGADGRPGFVAGQGAVSLLTVSAEGVLSIKEARFINELSGPLGITTAPRATGGYPKGSLFVCCGNALVCDLEGRYLTDPSKLGAAVRVFDPRTGKTLGQIDLGPGSAVAREIGHPALLPHSLTFDPEGQLYVSDTGEGGEHLVPPVASQPGILKITLGTEGGVRHASFTPVRSVPAGVGYNEREGALYWVTMGRRKPEEGALFRDDHQVGGALGPCGGLAFTPGGSILISRLEGTLVLIRPGGSREDIFVDPDTKEKFDFPSDVKVLGLKDQSCIVVVPEQAGGNPTPWGQRLRVLKLPSGY